MNHATAMTGILALTILMPLQTPHAQAIDQRPFYVTGAGNKSCGTVVKEFKENGWRKAVNSAWVSGYLSAFNEYSSAKREIGSGVDAEARDLWIYNYCSSNP